MPATNARPKVGDLVTGDCTLGIVLAVECFDDNPTSLFWEVKVLGFFNDSPLIASWLTRSFLNLTALWEQRT